MLQSTQTSALESHLGFWLRFVSNQVTSRFAQQLAHHDISMSEWVAMRTLFDNADAQHSTLIDALGMTKGAASKIISRLEIKGIAKRSFAQDSQRDQVISLTKKGQLLVPQLARIADENDAHFFGHLTLSEHEGLKTLMQQIVARHQLKQVPTN
jgi:DNA-binding MarR family transcriptional regulator